MGTVAFERRGGLVFVPVAIRFPDGHVSEFEFVLDTGTAVTMLERRLALRAGCLPGAAVRRSRVSSILGTETGYVVRVPEVAAVGVVRCDLAIACHRIDPQAAVHGLLGADFFAGLRLVIDYGTGTVELTQSLP